MVLNNNGNRNSYNIVYSGLYGRGNFNYWPKFVLNKKMYHTNNEVKNFFSEKQQFTSTSLSVTINLWGHVYKCKYIIYAQFVQISSNVKIVGNFNNCCTAK